MITVTSHEFRSNQKKYLDRVAQGVELLLTRKNESFKIVKASEDDARMGKEEFLAKIEKAISDVRDGKSFSMKPGESLDGFLERMEAEGHVQP